MTWKPKKSLILLKSIFETQLTAEQLQAVFVELEFKLNNTKRSAAQYEITVNLSSKEELDGVVTDVFLRCEIPMDDLAQEINNSGNGVSVFEFLLENQQDLLYYLNNVAAYGYAGR